MRLSALIDDLTAIYEQYGDIDVVSSKNREYARNYGFMMCSDNILIHTDGTIGIDIEDDRAYLENRIPLDEKWLNQ